MCVIEQLNVFWLNFTAFCIEDNLRKFHNIGGIDNQKYENFEFIVFLIPRFLVTPLHGFP